MPSVMIWSDGDSTRCCDSKCHEAKSIECDCICSGVNHGKGYKVASVNTLEMVKRELQVQGKFLQEKNGKIYLSDTLQKALPL